MYFEVTIEDELRVVEREISARRLSYARRVRAGELGEVEAAHEIAIWCCVIERLGYRKFEAAELRKGLSKLITLLRGATHTTDVARAESLAVELLALCERMNKRETREENPCLTP